MQRTSPDAAMVRCTSAMPVGTNPPRFTTTYGASEVLLNPRFRRMLVNATLWKLGMERDITPDLDISFVRSEERRVGKECA